MLGLKLIHVSKMEPRGVIHPMNHADNSRFVVFIVAKQRPIFV